MTTELTELTDKVNDMHVVVSEVQTILRERCQPCRKQVAVLAATLQNGMGTDLALVQKDVDTLKGHWRIVRVLLVGIAICCVGTLLAILLKGN